MINKSSEANSHTPSSIQFRNKLNTCPTKLDSTDTISFKANINPGSEYPEFPCDKYQQFLSSSHAERIFVIEKLIETFANVLDSIWKLKVNEVQMVPTHKFCNEILKRSKATYSTLQVSLFYVFRIKKIVQEKLKSQPDDIICCSRRMFLASLIIASKYLYDKNYSSKIWSKITSLEVKDINAAEFAFLNAIDYKLHIKKSSFDSWYSQLHNHIQQEYNKHVRMSYILLQPSNLNLIPSAQTIISARNNISRIPSPPASQPISPINFPYTLNPMDTTQDNFEADSNRPL